MTTSQLPSDLKEISPLDVVITEPKADFGNVERFRKIVTKHIKEVGSPWYTVQLWRKIVSTNYSILDKLRVSPYFQFVIVSRLLALTVMLIAGIILVCKSKGSTMVYGILGIYLTTQAICISVNLKCFYDALKNKHETPYNFAQFICTVFLEIIVCPLIPFVTEFRLAIYVDVVMISFFFLNFIYEVNLAAWLIELAFLSLVGAGETVYRLFKGNLKCPQKGPVILECRYRLYPYNESEMKEKICAICRAEFQADEKVCRLQCNSSHIFHEECIFTALVTHPFCPLCRQSPVFLY